MSNTKSFDIYNNEFNVLCDGIYVGAGCKTAYIVGDHHIYGNTFSGISGDAIKLDYWNDGFTYLPSTIEWNNFEGVSGYGVNVTTLRVTENAENNWWGHASGPSGDYGRVNLAGKVIGKGDAVSDYVDWDNWLPQPVGHTPHDPVPPGLLD